MMDKILIYFGIITFVVACIEIGPVPIWVIIATIVCFVVFVSIIHLLIKAGKYKPPFRDW